MIAAKWRDAVYRLALPSRIYIFVSLPFLVVSASVGQIFTQRLLHNSRKNPILRLLGLFNHVLRAVLVKLRNAECGVSLIKKNHLEKFNHLSSDMLKRMISVIKQTRNLQQMEVQQSTSNTLNLIYYSNSLCTSSLRWNEAVKWRSFVWCLQESLRTLRCLSSPFNEVIGVWERKLKKINGTHN